MVKYFFVLGRNRELSRAEIVAYFESRRIEFKELFFDKSFMAIDVLSNEEFKIDIQDFGGIVKLGKIIFEGGEKEFLDYVQKEELIPSDKFTYAIFGNVNDYIFMQKFKGERRKAVLKRGRRIMKVQRGDAVHIPNADYSIFAYEQDGQYYYGMVEQDYSYAEIKERDMKKPVRREQLAISPRLAKMLVNLSGVKPGQLLLDPFCGIGGILQEALIKGINVLGVDRDKNAIEGARTNLKWMEQRYELKSSYRLQVIDSRKLQNVRFDGIATEPALSELYRRKISDREAKEIIASFEKMIIGVLRSLKMLKKNPESKIVTTSTRIRDFGVDFDRVCRETGLQIYKFKPHEVEFPIKEFRADQFISRDVVVLV